jgi:excisionase family DNA binding protein
MLYFLLFEWKSGAGSSALLAAGRSRLTADEIRQGYKKGIRSGAKGGSNMKEILTTKDMAEYLKLHEITICKYAAAGLIPGIRIGRVWRFEKETIDRWLAEGQKK